MSPSRALYEALWAASKLLTFQQPCFRDNHYVGPPPIVRYSLERWSHEDERDNQQSGETWAPTYCIPCVSMEGDYCVGEWIIEDSLSGDTFHIACAPTSIRVRALAGTILCAFRATLCIDKHHM